MNCIWITTDSFRQDHVHCYRPEGTRDDSGPRLHVQTPNLDNLATESVLFERLRSEALPTVPCRRGYWTGRRVFPWSDEPFYKGMYIHAPGWRPLPQEDVTVAEHLSEQGFVTSLICDVYHLMKPSQNFHRGFQGYDWSRGQEFDRWKTQPLREGRIDEFLKTGARESERHSQVLVQFLKNHAFLENDEDYPSARTFRKAIDWLKQNKDHENFYLHIETFDPHEQWLTPNRYFDIYKPDHKGPRLIYPNLYKREQLNADEHENARANYAANCTMTDHWIGQLLNTVDECGLRESTLIIVVSDHGKIIGEFGHYGMPPQDTGLALNEVLLFMRHPSGEKAGTRFPGWLYSTDVTATMLSLLDVAPKPMTDGESVWPAVRDGVDAFRNYLVTGHAQMVCTWQEDWLCLVNTEENTACLYNLADDPCRQDDVADRYPSVRDDLAAKMRRVVER
ncbi:MAG: sulfatase [Armatimonadetes bacterium]|nr:sulfatase [Armatimonadota bacterium]